MFEEFKSDALVYAKEVLNDLPKQSDDLKVKLLINAAALLVEAHDTTDTRSITTRLSMAFLNNDPDLSSMAYSVAYELKKLGDLVPEGVDEQNDLVLFSWKMKIQDLKMN
jgi:hypothetical protein